METKNILDYLLYMNIKMSLWTVKTGLQKYTLNLQAT
jgi:hypothetical protein